VAALGRLAEMPALVERDEGVQQAGGYMGVHGIIPKIRLINRKTSIYIKADRWHSKTRHKT
jgi:hypothetical protein